MTIPDSTIPKAAAGSFTSPIPSIATAPLPFPPRLYVPLPMRDGVVAHALLVGTRVARGQALVESTIGAAHVPLSPAAGTIIGVMEVEVLSGGGHRTPAAEIEVDPSAASPSIEASPAPSSFDDAMAAPKDLAALIDRLRAAGVRADRRTSPDLLAQLHDALRRPIDTVVCNLLDATAESALNGTVLRWAGKEMIAGLKALALATGANRAWLAADTRLSSRASVFVRKSGDASRVRVIEMTNDYPQSDPTPLLYALLGRRLKPERLPTEVNTVLLDGAACAAIGRALGAGDRAAEPMLEVPIEVRDADRARCTVFTAPIGTPLRHILQAAGVKSAGMTFRAGAALRDLRVSIDAVVDGSELSVDAGPVSPPINPDPCIRCGWCVESCPVRIHPAALLEAAQDNDFPMAERYGLGSCIECGICSYVCPSRLPLLGAIRDLRRRSFPVSIE
ncbi:MAG: 4Fe-4S dicluster domain-containing protein [Tepidisphaeraceae bacterium]